MAGWLACAALDGLVNEEMTRQLHGSARLIEAALCREGGDDPSRTMAALAAVLAAEGVHSTLIDAQGRIRIDTTGQAVPARLLGLPEVREALTPGRVWGMARRPAGPQGEDRLLLARQLAREDGTPIGMLWLSRPAWACEGGRRVLAVLAPIGVATALAGGSLGLFLHLRFRRRVLRHAISVIRGLAAGEAAALNAGGWHGRVFAAMLEPSNGACPPKAADMPPADMPPAGLRRPPALDAALRGLQWRLTSQLERLDRQRSLLQSLVDQLGEGVIVTDANGRFVLLNPAAGRLLNLPVAKLTDASWRGAAVESIIPQHVLQRLLLPVDGPVPPDPVCLKVETADGPVWLRARACDVQLPEGESTGRVVVLTDVTDLERLLQVRSDFVANASHELRTPLSTIRAAVETLMGVDLAAEAADARGSLEKIARQSHRLEQMVRDLLDLSRLENPAERFEPEVMDGRQWTEEVRERFADELEGKQLHWQAEYMRAEGTEWRVNRLLLDLAVDNLIDNAIKFTPPGGEVGLHVEVGSAETVVEVCDTGCGIPPEEQERVFERFYQVERSRSGPQRGTGLGLAIVRHAVAAMGGTVSLESRVGQGTRVIVRIRRDRASA